jgi:hypothetical protein
MSENKDGHEVGYKKPPKEHRFKEGNQLGKRSSVRKPPTIEQLLQRKLNQKVAVARDGRTVKVPLLETLVDRLLTTAMSGTARDAIAIFNLIREIAPEALAQPEIPRIRVEYVWPGPDPHGHIPNPGPPAHLLPRD